ncbi:glutathione S-transferase C-terminal domain-containing protein [Gemmobacter caeni]|uniref:glutathione S-transferase C-terminal domain-containing protein n=1 Tax=Gemmobacter caeni TaxID=589035 RepID=UPI001F54B37D|nr:glutathione S-transferase C-terminal domain-containing protein [Gemmobacter caeni]
MDLDRLDKIWREGIGRFGGPFLAGDGFTGIDAFFAPIAFRLQTYGLSLSSVSDVYVDRLRRLPAMQEWYSASLAETVRESNHEAELLAAGRITADLRACT